MVDLTLSLAPGTYGAENREGPGITVSKRQDLHILHLAGDLSDTEGEPEPGDTDRETSGAAATAVEAKMRRRR